jgi:hypothetical protein
MRAVFTGAPPARASASELKPPHQRVKNKMSVWFSRSDRNTLIGRVSAGSAKGISRSFDSISPPASVQVMRKA